MKKIIIVILVLLVLGGGFYYFYNDYNKKQEIINNNNKKQELLSHYNQYVTTNKETTIYKLVNGEYIASGKLNKDIIIELEDEILDHNHLYFHMKDIDYYVHYLDVIQSENKEDNNRYKKYIVFNNNILTNNPVSLYDENGLVLTINESLDSPIWIKDKDKYYIEYMNRLLYVKNEDVKEIVAKENTTIKTRSNIRTLLYHQVNDFKNGETCGSPTIICHSTEQFSKHMKYLSDNNYLTLTMNELEMFLDGKIRIPTKSIVVTLDDGGRHYNAAKIVEEYKINATYFIITGTYDTTKLVQNEYMDYQSHTNKMHKNNKCSGGNQGGLLLCEDKDVILDDLALSQEKLGGKDKVFAFAYPFYDYNDRAISLLKQSGFRLAFIGLSNTNGYSYPTTNRFKLRRATILATDSMQTFLNYLK